MIGKKLNRLMVEKWLDNQIEAIFQMSQAYVDGAYRLENITANLGIHMEEEGFNCVLATLEVKPEVKERNDVDYPRELFIYYKGIKIFALEKE